MRKWKRNIKQTNLGNFTIMDKDYVFKFPESIFKFIIMSVAGILQNKICEFSNK